ncbi:nucleophile aminohydrolase [Lipomyces arxii]|uniref:nucleophile aminohydrolase n=1 Tax=Lipomyces arxii TaxID=56418 RepID=UPI0034CEDC47
MSFIALHLGAGYHSPKLEKEYKILCNHACKLGQSLLNSGKSSATVAAQVCAYLEDSYLTNAGTGSNLSANGEVECDASIMSTTMERGAAVGCISGVKNPVLVASRLLEKSSEQLSHGRLSPLFLVSEGAHQFAVANGLQHATHEDMTTDLSLARFEHWSQILSSGEEAHEAEIGDELNETVNDTIGVICLDRYEELAVASSSGGIAMKPPGRVGPAALLGSGVWLSTDEECKVATCSSGSGEDIISTNLASRCAAAVMDSSNEAESLSDLLNQGFVKSKAIQLRPAAAGVLAMKLSNLGHFYLLTLAYSHSTKSMCIGYLADTAKSPTIVMSRQQSNATTVVTGEFAQKITIMKPVN